MGQQQRFVYAVSRVIHTLAAPEVSIVPYEEAEAEPMIVFLRIAQPRTSTVIFGNPQRKTAVYSGKAANQQPKSFYQHTGGKE